MGFVYIFTNPCLVGWVKIGSTDNVEERLAALNGPSNIPFSFRVYATYEVDAPKEIEVRIHNLIDTIDPKLHAREQRQSGGERKREFFLMTPEAAYAVFEHVAHFRGDPDNLKKATITSQERAEVEAEEEQVERARRKRQGNFSFSELEIPTGAELEFTGNREIKCKVISDTKVVYNEKYWSITKLGNKLNKSREEGKAYRSGSELFFYEGELLTARRARLKRERRAGIKLEMEE